MIGDYRKIVEDEFVGCRCGRNHEKFHHGSFQQVFRYRGYKGIVGLFHKDKILPVRNVTHFALGNAIVGLNLSNRFYIISKHIMNRERLLFVSNTTDAESIWVCDDFWQEIKE